MPPLPDYGLDQLLDEEWRPERAGNTSTCQEDRTPGVRKRVLTPFLLTMTTALGTCYSVAVSKTRNNDSEPLTRGGPAPAKVGYAE